MNSNTVLTSSYPSVVRNRPLIPFLTILLDTQGYIGECDMNKRWVGTKVSSLVYREDQDLFNDVLINCQKGLNDIQWEFRVSLDGTIKWVRGNIRLLNELSQWSIELQCYDITFEKQRELLLSGHQEVLKYLTSTPNIIKALSQITTLAEEIYPFAYSSIHLIDKKNEQLKLGASPSLPLSLNKIAGRIYNRAYSQIIALNELFYIEDINQLYKIDSLGIQSCWIFPILSNSNEMLGVMSLYFPKILSPSKLDQEMLKDCAHLASLAIERYVHERELRKIAYFDSLTSLPNRSFLVTSMNQKVTDHQPLTVLFIDCDRFKMINDTFGYESGNQILKDIANELGNILIEGQMISRIGGDEFVILGDHTLSENLNSITRIFQKPWKMNGQEFYITASFGLASYPRDGDDGESLIKNAELACREAKREGRNHVKFFREDYNNPMKNQLSLENDLHYALERKELELFYQPQVNVKTGKITGAEALLRWKHPKYGYLSPADFIPLMEDTGLIIPIGEWLIQESCNQLYNWTNKGWLDISISVNISPVQFKSNILVRTINEAIATTKINPSQFKIEITENMLVHSMEEAAEILDQLKHIGVGVSIDDFGKGYSSLNYLKKFPIQTIKIDRAFVKEIEQDYYDQVIVKAIIEMGKSLDIHLIAEGTETEKQIEYLKNTGCDTVQGYYFSKPVPPAVFEELYETWNELASKWL